MECDGGIFSKPVGSALSTTEANRSRIGTHRAVVVSGTSRARALAIRGLVRVSRLQWRRTAPAPLRSRRSSRRVQHVKRWLSNRTGVVPSGYETGSWLKYCPGRINGFQYIIIAVHVVTMLRAFSWPVASAIYFRFSTLKIRLPSAFHFIPGFPYSRCNCSPSG